MASIVTVTGKNVPQLSEYTALQDNDLVYFVKFNGTTKEDQNRKVRWLTIKNAVASSPGSANTVPRQECFTIASDNEDTVTLASTPISTWALIFVGLALQTGNYTITGNDVIFDEPFLMTGDEVCVWYLESLGGSSAVQDLQSVTDVGPNTTNEISIPSLRFRTGSVSSIKNSSGTEIIKLTSDGADISDHLGNKVIEVNELSAKINEPLTIGKTVTFSTIKAPAGQGSRPLVVNESGLLALGSAQDLEAVTTIGNETENDIVVGGVTSTGDIKLATNEVRIINANNQPMMKALGASTEIYHGNTLAFRTNSTGVNIPGILWADGDLVFGAKKANTGETWTLQIDDQGVVSSALVGGGGGGTPDLDAVTDEGAITANAITTGSHTLNGNLILGSTARRISNSTGNPLFGPKGASGWSMYHGAVEFLQSEDLGLRLLSSSYLAFDGTTGNTFKLDFSGGDFTMLDDGSRGIIYRNAGAMEFYTGPDGGPGVKYMEIGNSGTLVLHNASNNNRVNFNLLSGSNQIVSQQSSNNNGKEFQIATKNAGGVSVIINTSGQVQFNERSGLTPAKAAHFNSSGVLGEFTPSTDVSWVNLPLNGGQTGNAQYMKDLFGWVHFRGSFTYNGTDPFADMPVGFRPEITGDSVFAIYEQPTGTNSSFVAIGNAGAMVVANVANGSQVWLDGISYYAG